MAIELTKKKKPKGPLLMTIVGVIAVFLVLGLAGSYIYFYIVNQGVAAKVQEVKDKTRELDETLSARENEVLIAQKRLDDFAFLLTEHRNLKGLFDFVDQYTMPNFWFNGAEYSEEDPNRINLSGESNSFFVIEQQIGVFDKQEPVEDARLVNISINEERGAIEFTIQIIFKPEVFAYKSLE